MQILLGKLKFLTKQPSRFYFYSPELHSRFSSILISDDNMITLWRKVVTFSWFFDTSLALKGDLSTLQMQCVTIAIYRCFYPKFASYCKCLIKICLLNKKFNAVTLKTNKMKSKCPEASSREKDSAEKHYSNDFI